MMIQRMIIERTIVGRMTHIICHICIDRSWVTASAAVEEGIISSTTSRRRRRRLVLYVRRHFFLVEILSSSVCVVETTVHSAQVWVIDVIIG